MVAVTIRIVNSLPGRNQKFNMKFGKLSIIYIVSLLTFLIFPLEALAITEEESKVEEAVTEDFGSEYQITRKANRRLLPQNKIEELTERENRCSGGFLIPIINLCLGGQKAELARETDQFQPIYVPKEKVVSAANVCNNIICTLANLIKDVVSPQTEEQLTGSLNTFRPKDLNFSTHQEDQTREKQVKGAYSFTLKMLLPKELGETAQATVTPTLIPQPTVSPPAPSPTPTPSLGKIALVDAASSNVLKNLIIEVGNHFKVPPAVIAAVSWIEGPQVWSDSNSEIIEYLKEGVRHPDFSYTIFGVSFCRYNTSLASGPMQFTLGTWSTYKNSVREAPGETNRHPIICNLKDSFWAAGKKLKDDSLTDRNSLLAWDKKAVGLAGKAYYGNCGTCPGTEGDSQLNTSGNYNKYACQRFSKVKNGGMSYCEYMWLYYQCNENSQNSEEFFICIGGVRP